MVPYNVLHFRWGYNADRGARERVAEITLRSGIRGGGKEKEDDHRDDSHTRFPRLPSRNVVNLNFPPR